MKFKKAYPNPPHKYADVIKAWADGAEIQYLCPMTVQWFTTQSLWFSSNLPLRIKPENPNAEKIAEIKATIEAAKKQLEELENAY